MDKKKLELINQKKFQDKINILLFEEGYLTDPKDGVFTEKALKFLNKKFILDKKLHEDLVSLFRLNKGVGNSYDICSQYFQKMCKLHQKQPTSEEIMASAEAWIKNTSYPGELAYFFLKDKKSRCIDYIPIKIEKKEFSERI